MHVIMICLYINQSINLHQQMSQSAMLKPSLKPQTASNADIEAQWL
jgi:hypothetical protein